MFSRRIFTEIGPELSVAEQLRSKRLARRAAHDARESITLTAKRQYRRYRRDVGRRFLEWPQWHEAYMQAYSGDQWYPGNDGCRSPGQISGWGGGTY
ncbi:hypothetical protein [Gordonia sp. MP11Mi]|uniref:Uncharacterized protein n=1 Tax=Gordonia sp. MP11Mi TaxID=3022769 RepID=A0AA97GVF8_9ACTN